MNTWIILKTNLFYTAELSKVTVINDFEVPNRLLVLLHIPVVYTVGDRVFGMVVGMSDCHPRVPGFDSQLYPRNFSGSIGSITGSIHPREDNWVAT